MKIGTRLALAFAVLLLLISALAAGQSTELKLKYHLQPIDLIDFSCKSSLDNEHPHGKKYQG